MRTFKIVARTNGWIAQRDSLFKGKCEITLESGLTLKEAQRRLLEMYREQIDGYVDNWGLAVIQHGREGAEAYPTHSDGTRGFDYDSRFFEIVEE